MANLNTGKDPYGNRLTVQNDRAIYDDFVNRQNQLKNAYAGKGSNNNTSAMAYNANSGYEKFKEQHYEPTVNKNNIFERQSK
jgi:hypothetical protein